MFRLAPLLIALPLLAAEDPLRFPKDSFTVETRTIQTPAGERKVTLRAYRHVPYVAKPVDKDYQSLDLTVPVEIDGHPVDASHAPILLSIPVGGYLSSNNAGRGRAAGPGGPGAMGPGGPGLPGPNAAPAPRNFAGSATRTRNTDLALAAGFVLVVPGVRGRDNKAPDGTLFGKAPAAIVDLKAVVRYLRHNQGHLPGNTNWIISSGVSAGGALSALLGSSGNSALYEPYLQALGAAAGPDAIFASADFCPIADLEHADMAYEWMYGALPTRSGKLEDQTLSAELRAAFSSYQDSLHLQGRDRFGLLSAANYGAYLLQFYLQPAATRFLQALSAEKRAAYLAANPWLAYSEARGASFAFPDYLKHVGRMKGLPAFDDFQARQPEPNEFGDRTTDSRHFTLFSLRHTSGNPQATLAPDLEQLVHLMNPMYFILQNNKGMAAHWWIRMGTSDAHTSLTVPINLAASLENRGKDVNTLLYWDAGHGADEDAPDFIAWISKITGYPAR